MKIRIYPFILVSFCALLTVKLGEIAGYTTTMPASSWFISDLNAKQAEEPDKEKAPENPSDKDEPAADKDATDSSKKEEHAPSKEGDAKEAEAKEGEKKEGDKNASNDEKKSDKPEDAHGEKAPEEKDAHGEKDAADKDAKKTSDKPEVKKEFTPIELDLLQTLSKRREELDKWSNDIALKENILKATGEKVNAQIQELSALKIEVNKLLDEYNKKDDLKIASLVKIYENMKPKDAAAIFGELDMPVLLEVVDKMKEAKVAPILAQMDPARAKELTIELAHQKRLPSVPETPVPEAVPQ